MNEVEGRVIRVEGTLAWVSTRGQDRACGSCGQREGCPEAARGETDERQHLLALPNTIGACVGDAVKIRARDGAVLQAVAMAYGLPLSLAFLGAIIGFSVFDSEGLTFAGLIVGLVLGFSFVRLTSRRREPILSLVFNPDCPLDRAMKGRGSEP